MELTVLGSCGSYNAPSGGACSGYLVRDGDAAIWMDCGNGTFANLQRHIAVEELSAVVITHEHPDHCVDLYGLHVLNHYGLESAGLPVYAPEGIEQRLGALIGDWGETFAWQVIDDGDVVPIRDVTLAFSRTDHPPPTMAVEVTGREKRLVYTADTGPDWSVEAFAPGADLVVSEATYQDASERPHLHLTATQAGAAARAAAARRLMITHLWPRLDPTISVEQAEEAFGGAVTLAAPHLVTHI